MYVYDVFSITCNHVNPYLIYVAYLNKSVLLTIDICQKTKHIDGKILETSLKSFRHEGGSMIAH